MAEGGCTTVDYEAAAFAICSAMEAHGKRCTEQGSASWHALLPVGDFHDRCFTLALSIAEEREREAIRADAAEERRQ